ncbi:MAG TPA: bacitracin ABC transporter ATP-binding protein, partial [Candidatus Deferrimicrobium sp.]|nr:bacitracin ABC transporter ATP-binding protein [Candidatus Deferrimicrobium sp.]
ALVNDPELILADEPTGNLDSQNAEKMLTFLMELNRGQGRTVVFITHNRELAMKAQRIIYLKDGEVALA